MRSVGGSSHLQSGEMLWRQRWWASCGRPAPLSRGTCQSNIGAGSFRPPSESRPADHPPSDRRSIKCASRRAERTAEQTCHLPMNVSDGTPADGAADVNSACQRLRYSRQPSQASLACRQAQWNPRFVEGFAQTVAREFIPFAALWATESSKLYRALLPA